MTVWDELGIFPGRSAVESVLLRGAGMNERCKPLRTGDFQEVHQSKGVRAVDQLNIVLPGICSECGEVEDGAEGVPAEEAADTGWQQQITVEEIRGR